MAKQEARDNEGAINIADQIAEFIGKTLGTLTAEKEQLQKRMSDIDDQIASVRQRVADQLGQYLPPSLSQLATAVAGKKKGRPAWATSKKSTRPEGVPDTAKYCNVCQGWTDHDSRSHRHENPKRPRQLVYGAKGLSSGEGEPRLVS